MEDFSHLEGEIEAPPYIIWWVLGIVLVGPRVYTFLAHRYNTTVILRLPLSFLGMGLFAIALDAFGFLITRGGVALLVGLLITGTKYYKKTKHAQSLKKDCLIIFNYDSYTRLFTASGSEKRVNRKTLR